MDSCFLETWFFLESVFSAVVREVLGLLELLLLVESLFIEVLEWLDMDILKEVFAVCFVNIIFDFITLQTLEDLNKEI